MTIKYVFDVLFTVLVIGCCDAIVWKSVFTFYDVLLLTHFKFTVFQAELISLLFGYPFTMLFVIVELPCFDLCSFLDKCGSWTKLIMKDIIWTCSSWASMLAWRGGWNLCTDYVMPNSLLGDWLCQVISGLMLMSMLVYSTTSVTTGPLDTSQKTDDKHLFDFSYMQHFCAKVRTSYQRLVGQI